MRILILSRRRSLYATRRLVEAATGLGHATTVADPIVCGLVCGGGEPELLVGTDRRLASDHGVVLPRIGSASPEYCVTVLAQLEAMGVPVVNPAAAIRRCRDKLTCLQTLAAAGLSTPRTALVRDVSQLPEALKLVGGPPAVVKLGTGTQGIGVLLAPTEEAVDSIVQTLWSAGQFPMLQELLGDGRGRDVRVLVVGGRVVAAMERIAKPGNFLCNLHRGAAARPLSLPRPWARLALDAVATLGLDVAGVDLMQGDGPPKVLEVNASPGFEGLEKATGADVASATVRHAVDLARRRGRSRGGTSRASDGRS